MLSNNLSDPADSGTLNASTPLHPKTLASIKRAAAPLPIGTVTLTVPQVARALNLSPLTISRWVKAGTIKSYKLGDSFRSPRRFLASDVEDFIKSHLAE